MAFATKPYVVNLGANGAYRLLAGGRYFKILSATGLVRIDGANFALSGAKVGQGLKTNEVFQYLHFTDESGAANNVTVLVSGDEFLDAAGANVAITTNKIAVGAYAQTSPATVAGVSTQLLAANALRQYLFVQNNHPTEPVYLNLAGAAAAVAGGLKLLPGDSYECDGAITVAAVNAFSTNAIAAGNLCVIEG